MWLWLLAAQVRDWSSKTADCSVSVRKLKLKKTRGQYGVGLFQDPW